MLLRGAGSPLLWAHPTAVTTVRSIARIDQRTARTSSSTQGNRPLRHLRRSLTHQGTLATVGAETGGRWLGGANRQLRALLLLPLVSQKLAPFICSENAADLSVLAEPIESGEMPPAVDTTYALTEVPAAIRYMQEGYTCLTLVLS